MTEDIAPANSRNGKDFLLGIYLNDHLAGATSGLELVRRMAGAHHGSPSGPTLRRLATEIADDRTALLDIMRTLRVPVRQYKVAGGWIAEKISRLKLNGHLLSRSPLSSLVELEALQIGVEGKAAGWRALRLLATGPGRLDADQLDHLITRATEQAATVDELRLAAAATAFPA
ncbi:MAG: hypothetical protein V7637_3240 [Mycobacteriales bacterium]|jgi:hypothetical protein